MAGVEETMRSAVKWEDIISADADHTRLTSASWKEMPALEGGEDFSRLQNLTIPGSGASKELVLNAREKPAPNLARSK